MLPERLRQRHAVRRAQPLRESAGRDLQLAELVARRLVTGEAARAVPAGNAVHHRDPLAALQLACHLVAEHRAGRGAPELLDVGAAETARADADERAGGGRLRQIGELGQPVGVKNDRAHRRIVGGARGRFGPPSEMNRERDQPAGRNPAEQRLARLPGAHEHGQQLLA